jgi:hypothetical protein
MATSAEPTTCRKCAAEAVYKVEAGMLRLSWMSVTCAEHLAHTVALAMEMGRTDRAVVSQLGRS